MTDQVTFEELLGLWEEGLTRLNAAEPAERRAIERAVEEVVGELQRRVGASFTCDELAAYYFDHGTDWCLELAVRAAPLHPAAWDMTTVAGAAFARFVRRASDFGGGRRTDSE